MSDQMKPWTQAIDYAMLERIKFLGLPQVKEKNTWLLLHIKGDGIKAPESWNAKVYTNKAEELKLVVTDVDIFNDLMMGRKVRAMNKEQERPPESPTTFIGHIEQIYKEAEQATCKDHCVECAPHKAAECEVSSLESRRIISIDDSGWGFPIGGTLVGLHDSLDNSLHYGEVAVAYYQNPHFEGKAYLWAAANAVVKLLGKLQHPGADIFDPRTVTVQFKVCTGYVNIGIVKELRERGFRVETCAIGEPLQSALEKQHREYIKCLTNADVYYDPKDLGKSNIGRAYSDAVEWIEKNNAWSIAKTGWKSMKKLRPEV